MQVADQDHADDDEQQAGDAEPDPVVFLRIENPDQVEDPGEDHEDAEQDREHVKRARRVEAHDDAEDQGQGAEEQRRLPRSRVDSRCPSPDRAGRRRAGSARRLCHASAR